jgi:HPt (histidine-containing phosphotransfer) domain-containing protein
MTGYVSKPIDRVVLFKTLKKNIARCVNLPSSKIEPSCDYSDDETKLFGIDIKEGIERIGSKNIYLKILEGFVDNHKNFVNEFQNVISEKYFETAVRNAHSLKGAAGNVSAFNIKTVAEELEDASRKGDTSRMSNGLKEFESAFVQVRTLLDRINQRDDTKSVAKTAPVEIDREKVFELAEKLGKCLQKLDPVESESLVEHLESVLAPNGFKIGLKNLRDHITHYDFDSSKRTLCTIKSKMKSTWT